MRMITFLMMINLKEKILSRLLEKMELQWNMR